ncbi:MAG TPA: D-2-hydroxyacid dehydrogenase [Limnochordia bacterium]|nr:D-2-hydroxyacid dehydrogenase [Limnochordia bacterium]
MIVLVTVPLSANARQRVVEAVATHGGEAVFVEHVDEAEISPTVIFGSAPVEYIASQPKLRWVQTHSAGVDHLLGKATPFPRHVILTNASGVYDTAGGEHILAMMLYFARGLYFYQRHQRRGAWVRDLSYARLLYGQTVCILGLGGIGRQVAVRARAFGMRVLGVKRNPQPVEGVERVVSPDQLDEVLPETQHLAITVPLTPETRGMIDARRLRLLPRGAFLYNIGRGAVVDEEALIEALQTGHLGGAGLDVFVEEPLPEGHPFWSMDNVLITPHMGADTPWDNDRAAELFIDNFRRFVAGEPLRNVVDLDLGY